MRNVIDEKKRWSIWILNEIECEFSSCQLLRFLYQIHTRIAIVAVSISPHVFMFMLALHQIPRKDILIANMIQILWYFVAWKRKKESMRLSKLCVCDWNTAAFVVFTNTTNNRSIRQSNSLTIKSTNKIYFYTTNESNTNWNLTSSKNYLFFHHT